MCIWVQVCALVNEVITRQINYIIIFLKIVFVDPVLFFKVRERLLSFEASAYI